MKFQTDTSIGLKTTQQQCKILTVWHALLCREGDTEVQWRELQNRGWWGKVVQSTAVQYSAVQCSVMHQLRQGSAARKPRVRATGGGGGLVREIFCPEKFRHNR